MLVRTTTKAMI